MGVCTALSTYLLPTKLGRLSLRASTPLLCIPLKVGRLLTPSCPLSTASHMVPLDSRHLSGICRRAMVLHPSISSLLILHGAFKKLGKITVCALSAL